MSSGYEENVFTNLIVSMYMYKQYLALNNLQWLICHKTKPNPTKLYITAILENEFDKPSQFLSANLGRGTEQTTRQRPTRNH